MPVTKAEYTHDDYYYSLHTPENIVLIYHFNWVPGFNREVLRLLTAIFMSRRSIRTSGTLRECLLISYRSEVIWI